jgi:diaminohydroxyphosphoribosylaminopyrimidine deaminase/5-amino-6-(5-phosphoribosylamino)uracil reductase
MEPQHSVWLQRALELARRGQSQVEPNPRVGAVLVCNDRVLGEGWHRRIGQPHAEVETFSSVLHELRHLLPNSTLYVTLEPCNHYGRTPPCTERILAEGVRRVVVGCQDPNPQVAGGGLKRLLEQGVYVLVADNPKPYRELIRHFAVNQLERRPFVTLKWARTTAGVVGTNGQKLGISGLVGLQYGHQLRAEHSAILVGGNTFVHDAPSLTTRLVPGPSPKRFLWADAQRLPQDLLPAIGWSVVSPPNSTEDLLAWLRSLLVESEIGSLLVEGGPRTHQTFLEAGLVDELHVLVSDRQLTGDVFHAPIPEWLVPVDVFELSGTERVLRYLGPGVLRFLQS